MNKDCKVYDIEKDLEKVRWLKGKLIRVPKNNGFNFDYMLFIPNNIRKDVTLIIEGSNTGGTSPDLKSANDDMTKKGLYPDQPIFDIANDMGLPVLYPLFPRVYNGKETIFNHMLSSNSLKDDTYRIKELGLERVDLQLIEMLKDAKKRLAYEGITIDDKYIINGFSASGKFANRFTLLHPELIKLCIAGAVSGVLTLPLKELNGEKLLYPVGLGDFEADVDEFKKVRQFYYMGADDQNNPFDFDTMITSPGIIEKDELIQMCKIFEEDMQKDRWPKAQELYKDLGINAVFQTYKGYGHDPRGAKEDMRIEIKNILGLDNNLTK